MYEQNVILILIYFALHTQCLIFNYKSIKF